MASITLLVPSRSTVVGPVPRGPNAASTASAPATDSLIAPGSIRSAVTTRSPAAAGTDIRAGSRTTAVTWWPAARACSVKQVPVAPVAPKTVSSMRYLVSCSPYNMEIILYEVSRAC